jgi:acyl-CoA synthetase (AMP-forming)/AMP-acid ligase II
VAYGYPENRGVTRLRRAETRADGPPEMTARLASVGHAETPVEVVILDEDGNPVPPGEVGEICVKNHVFSGYWMDPKASAAAMAGEFFRTGDMGRFDERFYLYIVDRKKDMIITGGENVYSREVEDALHRHPAVQAATVIGLADERWGERVTAVVVRRPGEDVAEADLIAFSQTQLARYKCPKQIWFAESLPLSGTGKIDKLTLRATYAQAAGATL